MYMYLCLCIMLQLVFMLFFFSTDVWSTGPIPAAQVAWFQANLDLGFSVSFPVIASLPGVIGPPGNCEGLRVFTEIAADPQNNGFGTCNGSKGRAFDRFLATSIFYPYETHSLRIHEHP